MSDFAWWECSLSLHIYITFNHFDNISRSQWHQTTDWNLCFSENSYLVTLKLCMTAILNTWSRLHKQYCVWFGHIFKGVTAAFYDNRIFERVLNTALQCLLEASCRHQEHLFLCQTHLANTVKLHTVGSVKECSWTLFDASWVWTLHDTDIKLLCKPTDHGTQQHAIFILLCCIDQLMLGMN